MALLKGGPGSVQAIGRQGARLLREADLGPAPTYWTLRRAVADLRRGDAVEVAREALTGRGGPPLILYRLTAGGRRRAVRLAQGLSRLGAGI